MVLVPPEIREGLLQVRETVRLQRPRLARTQVGQVPNELDLQGLDSSSRDAGTVELPITLAVEVVMERGPSARRLPNFLPRPIRASLTARK